ncbi:MAG TPA: RagB/SusD family nutrient uptake outer membrane protein [Saprospiraceae bacterium]|nr:RagB/SusD family nutrient uptake outer membrane protein [Saprospiraceae bacterium]HMP22537.1 RagB/SusD family nutrient uptake outer membrane protein [Saprospiraceae bacterium]
MRRIASFILLTAILPVLSGCFKDLDTAPLDPLEITSAVVYDNPEAYRQVLARLYAGLAVSGQEGPSGQADIAGIDEGFGQYLRGFWYHQELTTDEALIGWNDQTIQNFHEQTWTAGDGFIFAFYSRVFYQISICNEFLRETTDERLDSRGVSGQLRTDIAGYRAEARFLRALSYWHALDLFRNVPFVTERDAVGAFFPQQTNANDLFNYIESELLEIEPIIAAPRTNQYGRADRAAVWMLLAKLYLNAEVYIGQRKYTECLDYCNRIINAGFSLEPNYQHLFLADNDRSNEIIFPIAFDGINTRTWGGMTFIISAAIGGNINPSELGMAGGWGGTRTTREFVAKFPETDGGLVSGPNLGGTAGYPKVYVPGSHQGNDATDTGNSLSSPARNNIFEGHKYFPDPNTTIRFTRISSNSAPIYGDNAGNGTLQLNGAPIVVPEPGLYYIRVNWSQFTYTIEKREWFVAGNAVQSGAEVPMVWDANLKALRANLDMVPGGFRFVTKDPNVTLGDDGGNRILELNGAPITKITESGSYQILLFVNQPDYTYQINSTSFDRRGIFHRPGQTLDINDVAVFTEGIAVRKFKNVRSDGTRGSNATFPDTDFPMFRLADAYLMAAEAIVRNNGNRDQAAQYFNTVRQRAFQGSAGNVNADQLTLDLLLDERARELYWECHRRTDLVRFGQLTDGNYVWQWKGGVRDGTQVPSYRNIFPIPTADINANPNLKQNPNY